MRAEEGGNLPQRVLLVGGPKHGEHMNLPAGETRYEFTSHLTLVGHGPKNEWWGNFPETATHIYQLDETLSKALPGALNCFTHSVLWASPYQGGFNLHALTMAERRVQDAEAKADTSAAHEKKAHSDWGDATARVIELSGELSRAKDQARRARQALELATIGITTAARDLDLDYESVLRRPGPESSE